MTLNYTMSGLLTGGLSQAEDTYSYLKRRMSTRKYMASTCANTLGACGFVMGLKYGAMMSSMILTGVGSLIGSIVLGIIGFRLGHNIGYSIGTSLLRVNKSEAYC